MQLTVAVDKRLGDFALSAEFAIQGERLGLFGDSGSGKSTMVKLIAGLIRPDRGEIRLDDRCLYSSARGIDVPVERRRIALVFQQPTLFPHLNVRRNLLYGFNRCLPANRTVHLDTLVGVLGIGSLLDRDVATLSGGERQRIALGRAILSNPLLLLMDEPLSALDDRLRFQIIPYLATASERFGIPYLFISHSLLEMRLMAERVLVLEEGKVGGPTTPDDLARARMGQTRIGYINLLRLGAPRRIDGLLGYRWGRGELLVSDATARETNLYEISSRDIILFKNHPEATSARNLLECIVDGIFASGSSVGVELRCGGQTLVAEVTAQAARELGIVKGGIIYAAIKASAFRRLG